MLIVTFTSNVFLPNVMIKDTCVLLNTQVQLSHFHFTILLKDQVYKVTFSSGDSIQTDDIFKYLDDSLEKDINRYIQKYQDDTKKLMNLTDHSTENETPIKELQSLSYNSIIVEKIRDLVKEDNQIENIFKKLSLLNKK